MDIESWTASLHAGLIQRVRPGSDSAASGDREALGRATAAPFESAISRARSILSRSPDLYGSEMPERVSPAARAAPPARAPETHGYGGWAFGRRFNLTVRVNAALREMLLDARMRTGRTTQRILHDALVQYLDRLDRDQSVR